MRRLAVALAVLIGSCLAPAAASAALTIASPTASTTLRANQTLTVAWSGDGDAAANNTRYSYLLFTSTTTSGWSVHIDLTRAAVTAHSLAFTPDTTAVAFLTGHPDVPSVTFAPSAVPDQQMLPAGTYTIDLYIEDAVAGDAARASTVQLTIQSQCDVGTYSSNGWPPCTPASSGHYVPFVGATTELPCDPGTFANSGASFRCLDVPPGTYAPTPGATAPTNCSVGTYQANPGQVTCEFAPAGTYVALEAALAPTPCPTGTTSPIGATSAAACVAEAAAATAAAPAATSETPRSNACTVAKGATITAACVARQLGVSIKRPITSRLALPSGAQGACAVRRHRIRGIAAGSCSVLLVVGKRGSMPKTYRTTVVVGA